MINLKNLTTQELKDYLFTIDGSGKEYKIDCYKELVKREIDPLIAKVIYETPPTQS